MLFCVAKFKFQYMYIRLGEIIIIEFELYNHKIKKIYKNSELKLKIVFFHITNLEIFN